MPQRSGRRQKTAGRNNKRQIRDTTARQTGAYPGPGGGQMSADLEQEMSILQKYLEPRREREREIQRRKKEIMASKARKEKNRREIRETAIARTPRVSYVRKPFAVRSKIAMALAAAALLFGGGGLYGAVKTQGQATLTHGAMGLCSMILAAVAVWYGGISFLEDDKNYTLARLGIVLGVLMLAGWIAVVVIGLGGLG